MQIGSDTNWLSIAAGGAHTIALKSDGTLWAWGWNAYGQLGDGTNTDRWSPVQIILVPVPEDCANGIDDDGDGLIDCDDPDCGIDNDGDGHFAPPCGNDCNDANPNINPGKPEVCGDGLDNDCDGLIDCADPDCGIDNDGDGHFAPVWK